MSLSNAAAVPSEMDNQMRCVIELATPAQSAPRQRRARDRVAPARGTVERAARAAARCSECSALAGHRARRGPQWRCPGRGCAGTLAADVKATGALVRRLVSLPFRESFRHDRPSLLLAALLAGAFVSASAQEPKPRWRRRSTSPAARPIRRPSSACSSSSPSPGSSRPSGSARPTSMHCWPSPIRCSSSTCARRPSFIQFGSFPVFLSVQNKDLEKQLAWLPHDRQIVTVSNHSQRAGAAADLLAAKGFNVVGATGAEEYEVEGGTAVAHLVPRAPRVAGARPRRVPEPRERHDHARTAVRLRRRRRRRRRRAPRPCARARGASCCGTCRCASSTGRWSPR
jgi:hypothetical protein